MKLHQVMLSGLLVVASGLCAAGDEQGQPDIMESRGAPQQPMDVQGQAMESEESMGMSDQQASQGFDQMDRDLDGRISEEEAMEDERLSEEFSNLDEDEDGQLSADEFDAWEQEESEEMQY